MFRRVRSTVRLLNSVHEQGLDGWMNVCVMTEALGDLYRLEGMEKGKENGVANAFLGFEEESPKLDEMMAE